MRSAPTLTLAVAAVASTLAGTRRSHRASGRASAGAAGARRGRDPGEHVRDGTQTTPNIMTVRLIFFFLVVGCAAALPHGRLEPRPIQLYPMRTTNEGLTAACEPITEAASLHTLFGDDLVARRVLPILLVVRNDASKGSVSVTDKDIQLEMRGPQSTANREQLEYRGLSPGTTVMALAFGGILELGALQAVHDQAEYDLQNRVSEVALRSATLAPGESTSGVVYFPIDKSWLADAPSALVVAAQQLDPAARLVVRIPLERGVVQSAMRGVAR